MSIEIKVPVLPESVADATIATWHKQPGEAVSRDENLVDIETDKVVLEVVAPADGILKEIKEEEGETVLAEQVIAIFEEGGAAGGSEASGSEDSAPAAEDSGSSDSDTLSPAVRRLIAEHDLDPAKITGTGKGGRLSKEDVLAYLNKKKESDISKAPANVNKSAAPAAAPAELAGQRTEKRVPMTRLRARIAERLVEAQQTAAILTTFNEVNMKPIMDLRSKYKDQFEKTHDVRLGFMSFFVKAATEALKRFPAVNASIDGKDTVYHGFCDVGIAVSSPRGLVVPILRNAENMGLAEIESTIRGFGSKAKNNQLTVEDLTGGTFTISNGGVFGSLLSTPIINPPQSAILGMHKIQERPMVVDGKIEILPMMYLALSYDHRIIDGKESVSFLVTIKELLEDPARLILDI
ncbi:MAG: dihydrolipoyllysine-residue succinyltransferase [Kangiellaceae bacterium]|nr:dihydrolipoyllysine-residue succinyltransferase [Kangiellaceae bacterium]|tara:strand:- start:4713 stop:5936 length:1224 start_codon:yes stop_codon:yes gene_type:complete